MKMWRTNLPVLPADVRGQKGNAVTEPGGAVV